MARFVEARKEVKADPADQTVHAQSGNFVLEVLVIQAEESQRKNTEVSLFSCFL